MNNGERILNEIIKQGMIRVDGATDTVVFVWSPTSTDQLSALVEQIVQERLTPVQGLLRHAIRERYDWERKACSDARLLNGALLLLKQHGVMPSSTKLIQAAEEVSRE